MLPYNKMTESNVNHKLSEYDGRCYHLVEKFDLLKLKYILSHTDEYNIGDCFVNFQLKDSAASKTLLNNYLATSEWDSSFKVGKHHTYYFQNFKRINEQDKGSPRGRYQAHHFGIQNMKRAVRHTICRDFYYDIDIVNCHPVLLSQYCVKTLKRNFKGLEYYTENTKECRQELMDCTGYTKDKVKRHLLSLMNGGDKKNYSLGGEQIVSPPDWYTELRYDLDEIRRAVCEKEPALKAMAFNSKKQLAEKESGGKVGEVSEDDLFNVDGSALNLLLVDLENRVCSALYDFLREKEVNVGALCYDGLMVLKEDIHKGLQGSSGKQFESDFRQFLDMCVDEVKKRTGFSVSIVEKPMDEGYVLPEKLSWEDTLEDIFDFKQKLTQIQFVDGYSSYISKKMKRLKDARVEKSVLSKGPVCPVMEEYDVSDEEPEVVEFEEEEPVFEGGDVEPDDAAEKREWKVKKIAHNKLVREYKRRKTDFEKEQKRIHTEYKKKVKDGKMEFNQALKTYKAEMATFTESTEEDLKKDGLEDDKQVHKYPNAVTRCLLEMCDYFKVITMNSKPYVLSRYKIIDNDTKHSYYTWFPKLFDSFESSYLNFRVEDPQKPDKKVSLAKLWLLWEDRPSYTEETFCLENNDPRKFNVFGGLAVTREMAEKHPGDPEMEEKIKNFIRVQWCGGDEELFDFVLKWLAWMIQKPTEKVETALVLRGLEGTGKGMILQHIRKILGLRYFSHPSDLSSIFGEFNSNVDGNICWFWTSYIGGEIRQTRAFSRNLSQKTFVVVTGNTGFNVTM